MYRSQTAPGRSRIWRKIVQIFILVELFVVCILVIVLIWLMRARNIEAESERDSLTLAISPLYLKQAAVKSANVGDFEYDEPGEDFPVDKIPELRPFCDARDVFWYELSQTKIADFILTSGNPFSDRFLWAIYNKFRTICFNNPDVHFKPQ